MKTIQEVNQAIMFNTWTNVELASMIDAVKWARARLAKDVKNSIKPGQMVKFTSSRTGKVMVGDVTKIAIKFVTVRTPSGLWKVPASMLEAA
jgi:hypothetical protein